MVVRPKPYCALATLSAFIMSCNVNHQVVEIDENAYVLRTLAGKGTADGRVSTPYFYRWIRRIEFMLQTG